VQQRGGPSVTSCMSQNEVPAILSMMMVVVTVVVCTRM